MAHTALQVPPKAAADAAAQSPEVQRLLSQLRELGINVPGTPEAPSTSSGGNVCATATSGPDGGMSFACGACSQHNTVNIAKETFYVVTAGTSIGVFRDSALADSFVTGIKCSVRKKYSTLEAALGALQGALGLDTVKLLQKD